MNTFNRKSYQLPTIIKCSDLSDSQTKQRTIIKIPKYCENIILPSWGGKSSFPPGVWNDFQLKHNVHLIRISFYFMWFYEEVWFPTFNMWHWKRKEIELKIVLQSRIWVVRAFQRGWKPLCPHAVRTFSGPGSPSLRPLPHLCSQGRAKGGRSSVSLIFSSEKIQRIFIA